MTGEIEELIKGHKIPSVEFDCLFETLDLKKKKQLYSWLFDKACHNQNLDILKWLDKQKNSNCFLHDRPLFLKQSNIISYKRFLSTIHIQYSFIGSDENLVSFIELSTFMIECILHGQRLILNFGDNFVFDLGMISRNVEFILKKCESVICFDLVGISSLLPLQGAAETIFRKPELWDHSLRNSIETTLGYYTSTHVKIKRAPQNNSQFVSDCDAIMLRILNIADNIIGFDFIQYFRYIIPLFYYETHIDLTLAYLGVIIGNCDKQKKRYFSETIVAFARSSKYLPEKFLSHLEKHLNFSLTICCSDISNPNFLRIHLGHLDRNENIKEFIKVFLLSTKKIVQYYIDTNLLSHIFKFLHPSFQFIFQK